MNTAIKCSGDIHNPASPKRPKPDTFSRKNPSSCTHADFDTLMLKINFICILVFFQTLGLGKCQISDKIFLAFIDRPIFPSFLARQKVGDKLKMAQFPVSESTTSYHLREIQIFRYIYERDWAKFMMTGGGGGQSDGQEKII